MLILWDLNGTALDDMSVWYQAVRRVFTAFGANPPTIAEFFAELESGHFLEVYRNRGVTASEDELNEVYIWAYKAQMHMVRQDYDFTATVLALAEAGHTQGVVSSQVPELVDPLRSKLGLHRLPIRYWEYPVHAKSVKFAELLSDAGVAPEDALYIGDTPSDARHAHKAGIHAVTYLNGYLPRELFAAANTRTFIHSLRDVVGLTDTAR